MVLWLSGTNLTSITNQDLNLNLAATNLILNQGSSPLDFVFLNLVISETVNGNCRDWEFFETQIFCFFETFWDWTCSNLSRPRLFRDSNLGFFETETFRDSAKIVETETFRDARWSLQSWIEQLSNHFSKDIAKKYKGNIEILVFCIFWKKIIFVQWCQKAKTNLSNRDGSFDTHIDIDYDKILHMVYVTKCHKMP